MLLEQIFFVMSLGDRTKYTNSSFVYFTNDFVILHIHQLRHVVIMHWLEGNNNFVLSLSVQFSLANAYVMH